jgi:hypothetical protein
VMNQDQDWPAEAAKVAAWAQEQQLDEVSSTIRRVLSESGVAGPS